MEKIIKFDTSLINQPYQVRTPRDSEIQECLDTAIRENAKVELCWTIGTEHPATYVFPDSTIEDIRQKIDSDTYAATREYIKKKGL